PRERRYYLPRLRAGTSHTFRVRSKPPEASTRPSPLKARLLTWPVWPLRTPTHFRVSTSQSCTVSTAPVASTLPSELRARDQTAPLCPSSVPRCLPVATSQTRTSPLLLSEPPWKQVLPSGVIRQELVLNCCCCGSNHLSLLPVARSQTSTRARVART